MTNKDIYMIAYNILNDLSGMEGSRMTKEEGEAVKTTTDVLARNFTNETMWDIRFCMGEENEKEFFDAEVMARILKYNAGAEKSIAGDNGTEQIG